MELILVVAVLAVLAAAAVSRFGATSLANLGANADARRIALDLYQAQRRAISTGDNHFVQFNSSGGSVISYALYRRTGGGDVLVDSARQVASDMTITASATEAEFTFEGTALAAYQIDVAGPDRTWTISVIPATGAVRVAEP